MHGGHRNSQSCIGRQNKSDWFSEFRTLPFMSIEKLVTDDVRNRLALLEKIYGPDSCEISISALPKKLHDIERLLPDKPNADKYAPTIQNDDIEYKRTLEFVNDFIKDTISFAKRGRRAPWPQIIDIPFDPYCVEKALLAAQSVKKMIFIWQLSGFMCCVDDGLIVLIEPLLTEWKKVPIEVIFSETKKNKFKLCIVGLDHSKSYFKYEIDEWMKNDCKGPLFKSYIGLGSISKEQIVKYYHKLNESLPGHAEVIADKYMKRWTK